MSPRPPAPGSPAPGLPLPRRPAPRRLLAIIALVVLLIAALVLPVSAQTFTGEYNDTYISMGRTWYPQTSGGSGYEVIALLVNSNAANSGLSDVFMQVRASDVTNYASLKSSEQAKVDICISSSSGSKGALYSTGTFGYFKYKALDTDYLQIWLELDDPNAEVIDGNKYLKFFPQTGESITYPYVRLFTFSSNYLNEVMDSTAIKDIPGVFVSFGGLGGSGDYAMSATNTPTYGVMSGSWANTLTVRSAGDGITERSIINITKSIPGVKGTSTHYVKFGDTVYSGTGATNIEYVIMAENYPFSVDIYNAFSDKWYNQTFFAATTPETPDTDIAITTVYVRNSQTGALLANANLVISANVDGNFHEVVNETVPSGIYSIDLQPTGGGIPNPDYYRLWVTLDGYNSQMPYVDFEMTGATTLYVYMEPTAGGPDDENKTYIEFYVRDLNANPIAGAAVTCGGYTLITNSAGYTQFELPNNAAYPYRVTKSGYVTIEGRAGVSAAPRHTVNVVLGAGEIPTHTPTLAPGETPGGPGATPTPDTRTNEQKGQAIIDLIADFAEPIAILAILATIFGLMKMMTPGRR